MPPHHYDQITQRSQVFWVIRKWTTVQPMVLRSKVKDDSDSQSFTLTHLARLSSGELKVNIFFEYLTYHCLGYLTIIKLLFRIVIKQSCSCLFVQQAQGVNLYVDMQQTIPN